VGDLDDRRSGAPLLVEGGDPMAIEAGATIDSIAATLRIRDGQPIAADGGRFGSSSTATRRASAAGFWQVVFGRVSRNRSPKALPVTITAADRSLARVPLEPHDIGATPALDEAAA
jgi:hypothetical protein